MSLDKNTDGYTHRDWTEGSMDEEMDTQLSLRYVKLYSRFV